MAGVLGPVAIYEGQLVLQGAGAIRIGPELRGGGEQGLAVALDVGLVMVDGSFRHAWMGGQVGGDGGGETWQEQGKIQ